MKPHLWLIRLIGVIVPQRLRADWRQEWEAEFGYRERLLEGWDKLDWKNKVDLLQRSLGAFWDALWMQSYRWEDDMVQDFRFAWRMLLKHKGFTFVAVLTLSLGIGVNTAIFSVVNAVLLRPLPFPQPDELLTLWERNPEKGYEQNPPAAGNFLDWREQTNVFAGMAIYTTQQFTFAQEDQPERVAGAQVSASLFDVLRVSPTQGRVFLPEEEQAGREQVALISQGLWHRHFAADPDVVGKVMMLDGRNFTIVGVMPEGFQFPGGTGSLLNFAPPPPAELWVPLTLSADDLNQRSAHFLNVIARLKPGIGVTEAGTEMDDIQRRLVEQYPTHFVGSHVKIVPLSEQASGSVRRSLLVLWGTVGFVLLIACANVANLLLARAASRRKEMAVRAALGASRLRVIRQLLTESLLLSMAGGIGGILLAMWSVQALSAIIPSSFPRREEIAIDTWTLGFTVLVSVLTGLIFGLVPAFQSSKTELTEALKEGGRSATEGAGRNRVRGLLVIGETALALVLLIGAALMVQSFLHLQRVNPGFRTDHLLTMELPLPPARYSRPQRTAFFQQLIEQSRILPGVQAVAVSRHLPLTGDNDNFAFNVVGRELPPGQSPGADVRFITPDYFKVLGIPLKQGRLFSDSDSADAPPVLIINEATARRYFPDEDPIGKQARLGINNFTGTIVGVIGDVKHMGLDTTAREEAYAPYAQTPFWLNMRLTVRTSGDPLGLAGAMRDIVKGLDNTLPVSKQRTMEAIAAESVAQPRFRTLLVGLFGIVGLLLASIGIYGVMSYAVVQRTHEICIRMALGAQIADVLRLVIGQGLKLVGVGVALGLAASFGLTRLLEALLFEVSATDWLTFAIITLLLITVALLACLVPARRATRVDPVVALRHE